PPVFHLGADLAELRRTGQMVPVHRLWWEQPAAIGAGPSRLHLAEPFGALLGPSLFVHGPTRLVLLPVVVVVRLATGFAPRLVAIAPFVAMKLGIRLDLAAPRAAFHLL